MVMKFLMERDELKPRHCKISTGSCHINTPGIPWRKLACGFEIRDNVSMMKKLITSQYFTDFLINMK